jgi:hypothetical protein
VRVHSLLSTRDTHQSACLCPSHCQCPMGVLVNSLTHATDHVASLALRHSQAWEGTRSTKPLDKERLGA